MKGVSAHGSWPKTQTQLIVGTNEDRYNKLSLSINLRFILDLFIFLEQKKESIKREQKGRPVEIIY